MSRDLVIRWRRHEHPSREQLWLLLEDYLGKAADIEWRSDRFIVTLRGTPTFAFQRVGLATDVPRAYWPTCTKEDDGSPRPRWFEVWPEPGDDCLYVMTRDADDYTTTVADGFARLCARGWRGVEEKT